ncbi:MAG: SurA N-terminal domain-containing protein [Myxococcota bacterium]
MNKNTIHHPAVRSHRRTVFRAVRVFQPAQVVLLVQMLQIGGMVGALAPASSARADVVEQIVATVNEDAIFLSELRRRASPFLPQVYAAESQTEAMARLGQLYRELLEQLIDEELIRQAATRMQVRVSSQDLERAIANVQGQSGLSEDQFWEAVTAQGFTRAAYRIDLRRQLLRLKVLNQRVRTRVNITERDVRREYEQRMRRANLQQRVRASHIFLPLSDAPTATEVAQRMSEAIAIRQAIDSIGFAAAKQQYGGYELGWLNQGDLPEALEAPLTLLGDGQTSDPIRGPSGVHIFFLHEREDGGSDFRSFEDAKDRIYREMMDQAMGGQEQQFLNELRRDAVVTRRLSPATG